MKNHVFGHKLFRYNKRTMYMTQTPLFNFLVHLLYNKCIGDDTKAAARQSPTAF